MKSPLATTLNLQGVQNTRAVRTEPVGTEATPSGTGNASTANESTQQMLSARCKNPGDRRPYGVRLHTGNGGRQKAETELEE